jgi:NADH dehydrogenase FAD-containing subunit
MAHRNYANIVILGGSYAGLSVAHQFLRKTLGELGTTKTAPFYKVVLVAPNTHLYWNIGAPRAICGQNVVPHNQAFIPFLESLHAYSADSFEFVQGECIDIDFGQRIIQVEKLSDARQKTMHRLAYHALVIATGVSAHSRLLSLHGPHENTIQALNQFHASLLTVTTILIVGGGPSGVECAGNLASWVERAQKRKPDAPPKQYLGMPPPPSQSSSGGGGPPTSISITLISGSSRLLPSLDHEVGVKAEQQLRDLGVNIIHHVRLISAQELPSRATRAVFTNDLTLACDVFIPATGVSPNTLFLPPRFLDASGYVVNDRNFLRLSPAAGERVYAIGACCTNKGNLIDICNKVPTLVHNLRNDLVEWEIRVQYPYGGGEDRLDALQDVWYNPDDRETVVCPISKRGGVGVVRGRIIPSLAVWWIKGKDYGFGRAKKFISTGEKPFPASGGWG